VAGSEAAEGITIHGRKTPAPQHAQSTLESLLPDEQSATHQQYVIP